MIQSKCSPDKHAYLVDNHNSRTRKIIKHLGSLLAISALSALGIWTFTPVSEETNYKLDQAKNAIQINNRPTPPVMMVKTRTRPLASDSVNYPPFELPAKQNVNAPLNEQFLEPDFEHNSDPSIMVTQPILQVFGAEPETPLIMAASEPVPRSPDSVQTGRVEIFTIKSGDTLTRIFSRANLPISQAIELSKKETASRLNRLSIGKILRIYFDENDQWETLEYDINKLNTLIVSPKNGEFAISQYEKQVEYRIFTARGTIKSSLGIAAENVGVSTTVTQNLVDIYKWEIDFARDLQSGDTFSVVYQKAYIDDEWVADDAILAASFTTGGRTIEAIRYTDSAGMTAYFQPDGESLRRGFLRTPVKLARITSGFGKRRHPIKKIWKKHLGVDYGASRGAPVLSTADGVVQYSGKKGGYGKTVILRHGGIYTTLYAHLSKMGKGIRSGKAVTQGQVIGYVGRTGWATGDHLHYEFRVNGQHKNPLKVQLPKVQPLAKKEMDAFTDQAEPLLGTLTSLKAAQLATLDSKEFAPTL